MYFTGGDIGELGVLDGLNMWKTLINDYQSPRIEMLHNINPVYDMTALRRGDYKLVKGKAPGDNDLWYGTSEVEDFDSSSPLEENERLVQMILQKMNMLLSNASDIWSKNPIIQCDQPIPEDSADCNPEQYPCLFNVASDPCEYKNLARKYPRVSLS